MRNYLKATGIEVGLLINFGERVQIKRKVYNNEPNPPAPLNLLFVLFNWVLERSAYPQKTICHVCQQRWSHIPLKTSIADVRPHPTMQPSTADVTP